MQWWCSATGLPWTWTWQWYPGVHLLLILFGIGWWRLGRAQRWPRRPWRWFAVAWVTLLLTLDWPIGKLGAGYLASVHTGQFLLLTLVVAPALIRGIPPAGWRALAPAGGGGGAPPRRFASPPAVAHAGAPASRAGMLQRSRARLALSRRGRCRDDHAARGLCHRPGGAGCRPVSVVADPGRTRLRVARRHRHGLLSLRRDGGT